MQELRKRQKQEADQELYRFKLLILAIHADPQELLDSMESVDNANSTQGEHDDEIGDQVRLMRMSAARRERWQENKANIR